MLRGCSPSLRRYGQPSHPGRAVTSALVLLFRLERHASGAHPAVPSGTGLCPGLMAALPLKGFPAHRSSTCPPTFCGKPGRGFRSPSQEESGRSSGRALETGSAGPPQPRQLRHHLLFSPLGLEWDFHVHGQVANVP